MPTKNDKDKRPRPQDHIPSPGGQPVQTSNQNPFAVVTQPPAKQVPTETVPFVPTQQSGNVLSPAYTWDSMALQNLGYNYARQLLAGPGEGYVPTINAFQDALDLAMELLSISPEKANEVVKLWMPESWTSYSKPFQDMVAEFALRAVQTDPNLLEEWLPHLETYASPRLYGGIPTLDQMRSGLNVALNLLRVNPEKAYEIAGQYLPQDFSGLSAQAEDLLRSFATYALAVDPKSVPSEWLDFLHYFVTAGGGEYVPTMQRRIEQAQLNNLLNELFAGTYYNPALGRVTYTTDTARKGLDLLNLDEITRSEALGTPIPGQDSPVVRPQGGVLVGDEVIRAVGHEPAQTGGEPDPTLMGLQQVGGIPPVAGEGTGVQSTAAGGSQVKTGAEAVAEVIGEGAADEGVSVIDTSQMIGPRREYTVQAPNLQGIDLKSYKPFFDLASNFTNASRDSITGTGAFGAPAATETMAGAMPAGTTPAATTSPETNMTAQLQQAIESLRALPENSPELTNAIDRIMVQYGIPRQTVKDMMYGKVPVTYPVVSADRLAVLEDEIGRARQRRGNEQANSIRFIANKHDIDVGLVKEMVYGGMPITPAVFGTGSVHIPEQGRVLRSGMSGNDVQNVQQLLVNAGYSVGSAGADGKFGQETKDAVMRFQRDHGLKVDGVVDSKTWEELWRSDFRRRFKDQLAGVPGAGASATPGTIEAGAAAALSGDAKAPEPYTPEWFAMHTTPDFEIAPNRLKYMLDIRGLYPLDWNPISLKARMDALREAYPQGFTNVFEFDVGMALQNAYQALKHFLTDPTATVNFRALADAQAAAKQVYYRALIETQGAVHQAYINNLQIELERVKSMLRLAELDREAELKKEQAAFQHELDVKLAGVNFDFNKYLENMRIAGQKDIARIQGEYGLQEARIRASSGGGGSGGSGGPTWAQQRAQVQAGITADMLSDVFPRFTNRKNMEASVREYGRWFVNNGLWSEDFYLSLLDANKTPNAMLSFGSKQTAKVTVPGVGKVSDPLYLYAVDLANKTGLAPPKHRSKR